MTLNFTLWIFALLFIAALWNGLTAYTAMGDVDVQRKFYSIGLLDNDAVTSSGNAIHPLPQRKPVPVSHIAAN